MYTADVYTSPYLFTVRHLALVILGIECMRYLYKANIQNAMRKSEEVEQFLKFTKLDGKAILSWLTLRRQNDGYALIHHKQYDQGSLSDVNIYDFKYLYMPKNRDEPEYIEFSSLDLALDYASKNLGASHVKWVNQGVIQEEYRDFKLTEEAF